MSLREALEMQIASLKADIEANPDPREVKLQSLQLLLAKAFRKRICSNAVASAEYTEPEADSGKS